MDRNATAAKLSLVAIAAGCFALPVHAQYCDMSGSPITSLRTPLIYGATSSAPFEAAVEGQPPPLGDGPIPAPVNPGMTGCPTAIPSIVVGPSNDIANPSYAVQFDCNTQSAPGELGASLTVPPPPSTPGMDPGLIHAPLDFYPPPAQVVDISPSGGIVGSASTERWGGQTSKDFGLYKHRGTQFLAGPTEMTGSISEDGLNHARQGAVPVQDLYGNRTPTRNNPSGASIVQTIAPY